MFGREFVVIGSAKRKFKSWTKNLCNFCICDSVVCYCYYSIFKI